MASTTYEQTPRYYYDQRAYPILWPAVCDNFANGGKMGHCRAVTVRVRNAGHCSTDTLQPDGDRLPAERH